MALTKSAECGVIISTQARNCPRCGALVAQPLLRNAFSGLGWIVAAGTAAYFLGPRISPLLFEQARRTLQAFFPN